jgi:hypothetical protein
LVAAPDLGSGVERRMGSSPFIRTQMFKAASMQLFAFYETVIHLKLKLLLTENFIILMLTMDYIKEFLNIENS